ncbi:NUDIX domain-containing protein [Streptomyces decoyicus]|uniref:NUDIX hydrolase n=1 Tax=Streptomyces decoyicus TaxID=249567 RepID=UPI002E16F5D7|nr:NUDIX domain-containing protein [Streptomyces decoyicus]
MIDLAITADHIRSTLTAYLDEYPGEKLDLAPALDLLGDGADLTSRKEFQGHATAGAVLTYPNGKVLFIRHLMLDKWLLPGGHLEADDTTLVQAALRELGEETGIRTEDVILLRDEPIHIDVHPIPANSAKGEPEHRHIDFRFLFSTNSDVVQLQTEEVTDAVWRGTDTISDERLRARVVAAFRS